MSPVEFKLLDNLVWSLARYHASIYYLFEENLLIELTFLKNHKTLLYGKTLFSEEQKVNPLILELNKNIQSTTFSGIPYNLLRKELKIVVIHHRGKYAIVRY